MRDSCRKKTIALVYAYACLCVRARVCVCLFGTRDSPIARRTSQKYDININYSLAGGRGGGESGFSTTRFNCHRARRPVGGGGPDSNHVPVGLPIIQLSCGLSRNVIISVRNIRSACDCARISYAQ